MLVSIERDDFMAIEIRTIKKTDSAKPFRDFICELINEKVYIQINKKPTLHEEQVWLTDMKKGIKEGYIVWLGAWDGKKLIASTHARKGLWNEQNNAGIGISVLKKYRAKGLGEKLLRMIITVAKKKLKPKNIFLSVAVPNVPARSLYKKIGFKKFARFPKWAQRGKKYMDVLYMLLTK